MGKPTEPYGLIWLKVTNLIIHPACTVKSTSDLLPIVDTPLIFA